MDINPNKPTKEQVRQYMDARQQSRQPPPLGEQIRRELGWSMAQQKSVTLDR